jgi:mono/diheme cytochrome c family protein
MWKGLIAGIVGTLVVLTVAGWIVIKLGLVPVNADGPPFPLERWAAKTALNATLSREGANLQDPLQADDATILAGIKLFGENCSVCHGASQGRPTYVGFGLGQHAPTFGRHGVVDDPVGDTYWQATHGIRFTGMPSFGKTLTDTQRWQIATFLKNQNQLSPKAEAAWKKLTVREVPSSLLPPRRPGARM